MKKWLYCIGLSLFLAGILCACSGAASEGQPVQKQVRFLSDYIQCDVECLESRFEFSLRYLYQGKDPEIEFLNFDSPEADAAFVKIKKDDGEISPLPCYGYSLGSLKFILNLSSLSRDKVLAINSITLSVDGRPVSLNTTDRIRIRRAPLDGIYSEDVPISIDRTLSDTAAAHNWTSLYEYPQITLCYQAKEDVVIESLDCNRFLKVQHSPEQGESVFLDKTRLGSMQEVFPLSVKQGQTVSLEVRLAQENPGEYDPFSDFYCSVCLHYSDRNQKKGVIKQEAAVTCFDCYLDIASLLGHMTRLEDGRKQEILFPKKGRNEQWRSDTEENADPKWYVAELPCVYEDVIPQIRSVRFEEEPAAAFFLRWESQQISAGALTGNENDYDGKMIMKLLLVFDITSLQPDEKIPVNSVILETDQGELRVDTRGDFEIARTANK